MPVSRKWPPACPLKGKTPGALLDFALKEKIDLTVVGPESPLTLGLVDAFEKKGLEGLRRE